MQFKTYPKQFEDVIFWPIIRAVWEPFSLKRSHWWHWINYDKVPSGAMSLPQDANAKPRHASIWHNLIQTNFGWKKIAILKPKNYAGNYRLGFIGHEGNLNKKQICTLVLQGCVGILLSPYSFEFFAESYPERSPLELELVRITTKNNLDENTPLI
jgi:hypothetical protein